MNKIVKLAVFLAVIAGLSGLCMSFVNNLTAPVIEANTAAKELGALSEIFPNATFTTEEGNGGVVTAVYSCDDGVVYNISTQGFGGTVSFMLAIDNNGKYIGYVCNDCSNETSGLGSRVGTDEYKEMVLAADVDTTVDTLSGATVTSTACQKAIQEAAEMYKAR